MVLTLKIGDRVTPIVNPPPPCCPFLKGGSSTYPKLKEMGGRGGSEN